MRLAAAVLAAALATSVAAGAGVAQADPLPDGGVTSGEVAAALRSKGFDVEITKDRDGDPLIKSTYEKTAFQVVFYGCNTAKRCSSIQFSAGWDMPRGFPLARVNTWNHTKRFGRASLDDENDPFIRLDVDLEAGATTAALGNWVDIWEAVLVGFDKYLGE